MEQQKWLSKLLGYDYEIVFRHGKENVVVDALSRLSGPQFASLSAHIFSGVHAIVNECYQDDEYGSPISSLRANPGFKRNYTYVDGILRYKQRIVVVSSSSCMKPKDWFKWLSWAKWWYNTSFHTAIQMTPCEALYSRPPPIILSYLPGSTPVHDVDINLQARDHTLKLLKSHLKEAQTRMKKYADSHRTERSFQDNDWVYLRLQPYRKTTVASQYFSKLSPRFYDPFRVLEKIGIVAYKLELPTTSRINPVFHVSQLKKKLGTTVNVVDVLQDIIDYEKWEPSAILQRQMYKKVNHAGTQWIVQWKNLPKDEATCEDADDFIARFPEYKT
ncbi:uncharacterized protein LOC113273121 [Papaver somniferum]|uniref:uncharacterized protein LOC113273121 n=1 Tax=Papaver somniferum TaxID=3469 RepID=UPI000E6FF652|nr:uncharacterized protein LOC113273121 [Papaver somniferum]